MKKILATLLLGVSLSFSSTLDDAIKAYDNKEFEKAFELFTKSAKKKNSSSIYALGVLHKDGTGTKKDMKKAFNNFLESANLGNRNAQFNTGLYYEHYYKEANIEQNLDKAFFWYEKSAKQGHEIAQYRSALLLLKKDKEKEAYLMLNKSAKNGFASAEKTINSLCSKSPSVCK